MWNNKYEHVKWNQKIIIFPILVVTTNYNHPTTQKIIKLIILNLPSPYTPDR